MISRGSLYTLLAGGVLFSATAAFSPSAAEDSRARTSRPSASPPPAFTEEARGQADRRVESEPEARRVRLNHFNAKWPAVLQRLAEDTDSLLVMHDVPPGRFSRQDLHKYTRTEAIQILNQQLEPEGFRILEKGQYLTVLEMRRARSTFRRPVSPAPATESRAAAPAQFTGQVDALPLKTGATIADHTARPKRDFHSITDGLKLERDIRQTAGASPDRFVVGSNFEEASAGPVTSASDGPVDPTYHPRNRDAVDVARLLQESFTSRAKLLDRGPNGLPALQVFNSVENREEWPRPDAAGVWFTVEIDVDNNSLLVTAAEQTTRGLIELMNRLDVPPPAGNEKTRLVAGSKDTLHLGRELQPELARLRQRKLASAVSQQSSTLNQVTGQYSRRRDQLAFQDQPRPPAPPQATQPGSQVPPNQAPPSGDGPAQIQGQLPAILGGLRSEVTIEALDDLNLLILRGNEQDIAQVMQVIQTIEQLAVGSRPAIDLLFLQHVNSFALAELLNSLYQELEDLRNVNALQGAQSVQVVPVGTPNAIMILAPQAAMENIKDLASKLDQPADPLTEVEIFPLQYAVATQARDLMDQFFTEPLGLEARVRVEADIRTNSLIVHARPNDMEQVRLIIRRIDRGTSAASNQLRVITLQHAAADELAEFLNTTIQGILNPPVQPAAAGGAGFGAATQGAPELRDTKSVVLEFLTTDGTAQRLVRSGLLTDVRVTADLRTNSLTVAAPKETLELLIELIDILDQPSATVADIKVFQLENADAATAIELLTELFESDEEDALGIAIAGAEDASSSLIPLKFSYDARTNTVVAIGGTEALRVVEAILLRLDQSNIRQRRQEVIKLQNSPAVSAAAAINEFIQAQINLVQQVGQDQLSAREIVDQTYIVVADEYTNTLLISASPRYFDDIVRIAKKLDAQPPQVMMQAMLVEVELDDTDEFGIELGFQDPVLFSRSLVEEILTTTTTTSDPSTGIQTTTENIISQTASPGFLFNSPTLGNNIAGSPSTVGSQGLSNFGLGRINEELGFGGLVLQASSDAVNVLIRALEARRNVRILSRPQVMALDNQVARIQDGQTVPVINGFAQQALTFVPLVEQRDIGIILEVTPQINPAGQVVMIVNAQKSGLTGEGVPLVTDPTTGATIEAPIIDVILASTRIMVNDGQTVVLGGMIIEEDITIERKVPWLGDVPLLGQLFRYDGNNHRRSELLVFLTPRIVYNDADFELIKQVETERMHFFEHEAEEVHGPLFGVPPGAANVPPIGEECEPENGFGYEPAFPDEYPQGFAPPLGPEFPSRDMSEAGPVAPPAIPPAGPFAPSGGPNGPPRGTAPRFELPADLPDGFSEQTLP